MNKITATILALLILLPMASAAINVGTGAPPSESERASSVQVLSFGDNAMICVNCPALTSEPEPGFMQATLAERFPRIICKGDTPCVIYTGLKYKGMYTANPSSENQPYSIVTKDGYQKGKPITKGNLNFALEDGQIAVDAETKKMYDIENPQKIILQNAKAYFDNAPAELAEDQEAIGRLWKIRGLDKRAPNQLIGEMSIPLKKGDTLTFMGLFGDKDYSLEKPVLNIGRFTDNEDVSTAEDEDAEDWLDELDNKFLDADKDRSELKICSKKFANYYAGSAFELKANEGRCDIAEYFLNTELFEEDDAEDNKLFAYSCGDIAFEAVGGNAKNLYCNQEDIHNALLSCGKDGNNPLCTGVQGKSKFKVRIGPSAFDIDNTQGYMFRSITEVSSNEQKAYHFQTGKLKIRTHPQSENPLRHDTIFSMGEKPLIVTYKDSTAQGTNTITLPENTVVSRVRNAQIFSYMLKQADYKGVLGEGLHQINLIYPEGLERNEQTSTKIREAKTRGATRADIALLGAVAEESIAISSPTTHLYTVTPTPVGQESDVEAQTVTPSTTAVQATMLGEYAYRHCFYRPGQETPEFRGAAREATEKIAKAILESNPGLIADPNDILNTPIPAGTVLNLPGTTTEYRLGSSIVRVRVNTQGCFGLSSPAIQGEQCMEKPGAIVKCVPASRQSECTIVYQEGEGVKGCQENNVCCEVKLAQAGEYCVNPEAGRTFMSNGAKCSATCRSEVTDNDYTRTGKVANCAEGLKCCKSVRRSTAASSTTAAAPARVRDNSACTILGGTCDFETPTAKCMNSGRDVGFLQRKCFSKPDENYLCCIGSIEEIRPRTSVSAAQPAEAAEESTATSSPARATRRINYEPSECESKGGVCKPGSDGCASTEVYIASCLALDGDYSCCKPAQGAQPSAAPQAGSQTTISTPEGSMCKSIRGTCRTSCGSEETRYSDELQGCAAGSSCCIAFPLCTGFEWSDSLRKQVCTGVRL